MAILPTVSVSFKEGDKKSITIINAADFDGTIHVKCADQAVPAPVTKPADDDENPDAVDITEMTVSQAKKIIAAGVPDHILSAFAVAEAAGKNRRGVIDAIKKARS
jgi:hypothetical protein